MMSDIARGRGQGGEIEKMMRGDLLGLKAYQPIIPLDVLSERAGVPIEGVIKLDGNENPYGCSPRVGRALAGYPFYHILPPTRSSVEITKSIRRGMSGWMQHIS